MSQKKIVIEIEPDGSTTIDAQGFKGNSCSLATKELQMVLAGSGPVDTKKKPDYFALNPTANTAKN